jgi:endoglucanase
VPHATFQRIASASVWIAVSGRAGAEGACSSPVRGINLVPLPTGWVNGQVVNQFPGEEHIIYYKSVGFNAIRLPISWEAAQPALMGALDSAYLSDLKQFLAKAEAQGVPVMVEVHNYDRYRGKLVGSPEVPGAAFQDLWRRLADALKDQKIVYGYGLMNEPHDTNGTWQTFAQYGVNGVRSVDSSRKIYVGGDGWSNSQLWPSNHPTPSSTTPQGKSSTRRTCISTMTSVESTRIHSILRWISSRGRMTVWSLL